MKKIREMDAGDVREIVRMEEESFSDPWSERSVLESLRQSYSYCLVAEEAEEVIGYLIFYKSLDEGEILRIAVKRAHRRMGVASDLVDELRLFCAENHIKRVMLDVRKSNQRARKFYKKKGYGEDGTRRHFYSNPEEDAVLMSRRY